MKPGLGAGEYFTAGGFRFEGTFDCGRALGGSEGTWTDRGGTRYRVTLRRTVAVWDIGEAEFAARVKVWRAAKA